MGGFETRYDLTEYKCYAVPYGVVGIVCDILSIYIFIMVAFAGRSPLLFRRLRHRKWAVFFFFVKGLAQMGLQIGNLHCTFGHDDLMLLAFTHLAATLFAGTMIGNLLVKGQTIPLLEPDRPNSEAPQPTAQSLRGTSSSSTPSLPASEPPPPYAPFCQEDGGGTTQDGFEMQTLNPRNPRATTNTSTSTTGGPAGTTAVLAAEEGRAPGMQNPSPLAVTGGKGSDGQKPHAGILSFIPILALGIGLIVTLYIGIYLLIEAVPIEVLNGREKPVEESYGDYYHSRGEEKWEDKEEKQFTQFVMHLAIGCFGLLVGLIASLLGHFDIYERFGQRSHYDTPRRDRGQERIRLRDYWGKLVRNGPVAHLFWAPLMLSLLTLGGSDFITADHLLGRATQQVSGLRAFGPDERAGDVVRYWFYVAFNILPFLAS